MWISYFSSMFPTRLEAQLKKPKKNGTMDMWLKDNETATCSLLSLSGRQHYLPCFAYASPYAKRLPLTRYPYLVGLSVQLKTSLFAGVVHTCRVRLVHESVRLFQGFARSLFAGVRCQTQGLLALCQATPFGDGRVGRPTLFDGFFGRRTSTWLRLALRLLPRSAWRVHTHLIEMLNSVPFLSGETFSLSAKKGDGASTLHPLPPIPSRD